MKNMKLTVFIDVETGKEKACLNATQKRQMRQVAQICWAMGRIDPAAMEIAKALYAYADESFKDEDPGTEAALTKEQGEHDADSQPQKKPNHTDR